MHAEVGIISIQFVSYSFQKNFRMAARDFIEVFASCIGSMREAQILLSSVLGLYILWSLWTFTMVPKLWPNEPKVYPYWMPYIGMRALSQHV